MQSILILALIYQIRNNRQHLETRKKGTCNIEEKRIEVLRDGRKDDQPQLPLSPSNNVLNQVINKNVIVGTNFRGNKIKRMPEKNSKKMIA